MVIRIMTFLILTLAFLPLPESVAQTIDEAYFSTEELWQKGKTSFTMGKQSSGEEAVRHFADSLAYLYAYFQRNDQLSTGNDQHSIRLRSAIRETHEYLRQLRAGTDVKGDVPGQAAQGSAPNAPSTALGNPPARPSSKAVFSYPRVRNGLRLDWCEVWGDQCGTPAALAYCREHGFQSVTRFSIDADIGSSDPTFVTSANRRCDTQFCDGFSEINCIR